MNKMIKLMLIIIILSVCAGCTSIFRIDGPYTGKVLDSETKQPIEDAVVLGIWYTAHPNVAGRNYQFNDSIELLTDKNGEFQIPGKGLLILSNLDEMFIVIYKSGYEMVGNEPWTGLKSGPSMNMVKWENNKAIILLNKLSTDGRKKQIVDRIGLPGNREKLLTKEINKERAYLGYDLFKEVE